jgi:hypothetical protein
MCYGVYISTDYPADLAKRNSERVRFARVTDPNSDPCTAVLEFPHRWYVGSKSGCSCTFRHLHPSSAELGFAEPVGWFPEEQDEIDATQELYRTLRDILSSGYQLDLVDRWEGSQPADITVLEVSLEEISEREFRMIENHKFRLRRSESQG